jgi:hypothetical protein
MLPHNVRGVTAYDELNAFQFKGGKGYDKRSVEEFRARTLNVLDDVLRANVHLEERLAHKTEPQAALGPALSADEQDLLDRYRSLTSTQRYELLQRMDGVDSSAPVAFAADLDHWSEDSWTPIPSPSESPSPSPSDGGTFVRSGSGELWGNAPSAIADQAAAVASYSQPDWLTEWESAAPLESLTSTEQSWGLHEPAITPLAPLPSTLSDTFEGDWTDQLAATDASFEVLAVGPASTPHSNEVVAVFREDDFDLLSQTQWAPPDVAPAVATMPPFMPPAQPGNEVGIPIASEVVEARPEHRFQESPLSPDRLDDLFSQLDFGPPSLDLLPHVHAGDADLMPHGAPMHVALAPQDDQPLPPPVRPWEGWIK